MVEVGFLIARLAALQTRNAAIQHGGQVVQGFAARGVAQIPAAGILNVERIVELVGLRTQWLGPIQPLQNPAFLKPTDMPQLPERRLDVRHRRADQLLLPQVGEKFEFAPTRVPQLSDQLVGGQPVSWGSVCDCLHFLGISVHGLARGKILNAEQLARISPHPPDTKSGPLSESRELIQVVFVRNLGEDGLARFEREFGVVELDHLV